MTETSNTHSFSPIPFEWRHGTPAEQPEAHPPSQIQTSSLSEGIGAVVTALKQGSLSYAGYRAALIHNRTNLLKGRCHSLNQKASLSDKAVVLTGTKQMLHELRHLRSVSLPLQSQATKALQQLGASIQLNKKHEQQASMKVIQATVPTLVTHPAPNQRKGTSCKSAAICIIAGAILWHATLIAIARVVNSRQIIRPT